MTIDLAFANAAADRTPICWAAGFEPPASVSNSAQIGINRNWIADDFCLLAANNSALICDNSGIVATEPVASRVANFQGQNQSEHNDEEAHTNCSAAP